MRVGSYRLEDVKYRSLDDTVGRLSQELLYRRHAAVWGQRSEPLSPGERGNVVMETWECGTASHNDTHSLEVRGESEHSELS